MSREDQIFKCELTAHKVLENLNVKSLPVDPFKIAESHGIACFENSSLQMGISGFLLKAGDRFAIFYSSKFASDGFRRFTIAHELGHYFLEGHVPSLLADGAGTHNSESGFLSTDQRERQADYFAAGLLMPREPFIKACSTGSRGLAAIEELALMCQTSLTSTAIRYADVTRDVVAVLCSQGDQIQYCFMSDSFRNVRGLTWPKKGSGLPLGTATIKFNRAAENVLLSERLAATSNLDVWFDGHPEAIVNEEVVGLGGYGRTLTVLTVLDIPGPDEEGEEDEDLENMLPSDRWRAVDKKRRWD